jgi:hypothetical protein
LRRQRVAAVNGDRQKDANGQGDCRCASYPLVVVVGWRRRVGCSGGSQGVKESGPAISSHHCKSALMSSPYPQLLPSSFLSWLRQALSPSSRGGCPPWHQRKGMARNFEGAPTTSSTRQSGKECNHCSCRQRQVQQCKRGRGQFGWKGGGGTATATMRTTTTMHSNTATT